MTRFRPFRNSDPPALVRLWNQAIPQSATARPLRVHELDTRAFGVVPFEAPGLIVGERDGRIVGFVHAGFGPELSLATIPPFQLGHELGTIAMLVVEPGLDDRELVPGLLSAAEHYLRARGAQVVYAGGLFPLNPFYWGLYGGSEGSGVLSSHEFFHRALVDRGYQPVSSTVLLEADLSNPEPRDPRAPLIRRQTQLELLEDALPANWWESLAVGQFPLTEARLMSKSDGVELAHASTWDMQGFDRADGRARIGLINLAVAPDHRRKGYGRFLVSEILRRARANLFALVEVQTVASNQPALALYTSLGFVPIEQSILYRLESSSP